MIKSFFKALTLQLLSFPQLDKMFERHLVNLYQEKWKTCSRLEERVCENGSN